MGNVYVKVGGWLCAATRRPLVGMGMCRRRGKQGRLPDAVLVSLAYVFPGFIRSPLPARSKRRVKNAQRPRGRPRESLWGPWSVERLLFDAPRRAGIVVNQGSTAPPIQRSARRRQQSATGAETARGAGVTTVRCGVDITAAAIRSQSVATFAARARGGCAMSHVRGAEARPDARDGRLCLYPYTELAGDEQKRRAYMSMPCKVCQQE